MNPRGHSMPLMLACFVLVGSLSERGSQNFAADENDPRRPPGVEAEGVPAVPADLAERLNQYQNFRSATFRGWAPSGQGILIATRFGNSSQLHRVYEPAGRREQITFMEEPVSGSFIPSDPHDGVLLSMSQGGNENFQALYLDLQHYSTSLLTDGKSRNSVNAVRMDGSLAVVGSNCRNGRDTDLYLADPRKPDSMELLMQTEREFWSARDWSQDGKTLLLARYVSANEGYFSLLDIATRKRTDLSLPDQQNGAVGSLAFSPDAKSIYIATDALSEFRKLARYDIDSKTYDWLSQDIDWDIDELDVEPKSGQVAFTVNADGVSRIFLISGGKRRELLIPLGIVSGLEFSPDGAQLGFTLARPDAPADAYSLQIRDQKITRWTYSETGGLDPGAFVVPHRIQFRSFDDREIPAYYFRPSTTRTDRKLPVLINIHGGPEGQYQPFFSGTVQFYLNELGLAVIFPNVRGSNGYGKTYLKLDNGTLREDSVKDIGGLLDWVAQQPELDASRVAVSGGSYGGYMVLASLTHFPDRIKAGIDIVGIANYITFLENTAPYRQDLRRAEYGDERDPKMREFFQRINPTSNASKISSALLVAHGKNDPRVPFSEAEQIASVVRSLRRPVWTVFAENEGHGFDKKNNVDYLRAVEILFLKQHLGL